MFLIGVDMQFQGGQFTLAQAMDLVAEIREIDGATEDLGVRLEARGDIALGLAALSTGHGVQDHVRVSFWGGGEAMGLLVDFFEAKDVQSYEVPWEETGPAEIMLTRLRGRGDALEYLATELQVMIPGLQFKGEPVSSGNAARAAVVVLREQLARVKELQGFFDQKRGEVEGGREGAKA